MASTTASLTDCKEFQQELVSELGNDQEQYSYAVAKTVGMMDGSGAAVWTAFFDHKSNELWVKVPTQYSQFSKETVTAFLDMAEGSCGKVFMCVPVDSVDKAVLVKNFMYMGFQLGSSACGVKQNYVVLCYSTDDN